MAIIAAPQDLTESDVFVDLEPLLGRQLYLKCEGLNFGGSIKLRAAASMISAAERAGTLGPDSVLIESSSGNLGVALSIIAANKGLRFTCVTDRRCNEITAATMRALGTDLVVIDEPDPEGGYLAARLDWVRSRCAADERYVWLNQYTNEANWGAHYGGTAPMILKHLPDLEVLFVGVGTAGTAMGCARYFKDIGSPARIVGIDSIGSVSFGNPPGPRLIPGLGAGVRPALLDLSYFDDLVEVAELDSVRTCRSLASRGMLFGGSTGTVVSGAMRWLERNDPGRVLRSACISPDMGDRYLSTLYDDAWVLEHFGPRALEPLPAFSR
ncbi:2,3-diaminopropionate biosynthesis protein SbnA [Kitasatospora sp. NPDC058162]|uniref:2,3-diaminopropionate biosynthesis protein SbnA n=1 Tax=Kitasatospora sp. NPDC058162 TaxID=3346362 RepID=UPI0036D8905C